MRIVAVAAFALLTGCFSPPKLSGDVTIRCAAQDECPQGRTCNLTAGICIDANNADHAPPTLTSIAVPDAPLAAGAAVAVSFTVSEELLGVPVVVIAGRDHDVVLAADPAHSDAAHRAFAFAATLAGDEGDGVFPVLVTVEDKAGNSLDRSEIGRVTFDFTPPALVGGVTVAVAPAAGSPLSSVSEAGAGSVVSLSFTVDEALAGEPVVTATSASSNIPFTLTSAIGNTYAFSSSPVAADAGTYQINIDLVDTAQNPASISDEDARFDVRIDPPALASAAGLLLVRAPFGTLDDAAPSTSVDIDASLTAPDAVALAFFDDLGAPLATTVLPAARATLAVDRASVFVSAVDAAGNASAPVLVDEQEWIAVASAGGNSPHRFEARPALDSAIAAPLAPGGAANADAAAIARVDGSVDTVEGGARWRRGSLRVPPVFDDISKPVWDGVHGVVVAVTVEDNGNARTRLWDGSSLRAANVLDPEDDSSPPTTGRGASIDPVFDPRRGVVIALEPTGSSALHWEWNGVSWKQRDPAPGVHADTRLAFDERRGVVVACCTGGNRDEMLEWDGVAWTSVAAGTGARASPALAWDATSEKMILRGGKAGSTALADQWENAGDGWVEAPASAGPSGALDAVTAGDGTVLALETGENGDLWHLDAGVWTDVVVDVAGTNTGVLDARIGVLPRPGADQILVAVTRNNARDLLVGSLATSSFHSAVPPLDADQEAPNGRFCGATAYDERARRTVLLCADPITGATVTWLLDGATWSIAATIGTEIPGYFGAAAFDDALGGVVDYDTTGSIYLLDAFDAPPSWSKLSTSGPVGEFAPLMGIDRDRDQIILVGGGETWRFDNGTRAFVDLGAAPIAGDDGSNDGCVGLADLAGVGLLAHCGDASSRVVFWDGATWQTLPVVDDRNDGGPTNANGGQLVSDGARHQVLFERSFGKTQETWALDASLDWRPVTPPDQAFSTTLASRVVDDVVLGRVVLVDAREDQSASFEGSASFAWDGTDWRALPGAVPAPPLFKGAAVTGDDVGNAWLFGGLNGAGLSDALWRFDGARWHEVATTGTPPSARAGASVAFDPSRGALVVFGGGGATLASDAAALDTTTLTWSAVPVGVAGAPAPRTQAGLVYYPPLSGTVLFGGSASATNPFGGTDGALWLFADDGGGTPAWSMIDDGTAGPGPRETPTVGTDGTTLFVAAGHEPSNNGTSACESDLWTWTPTAGFVLTTDAVAAVANACSAAIVEDPERNRAILLGKNVGTDNVFPNVGVIDAGGVTPLPVFDVEGDGDPGAAGDNVLFAVARLGDGAFFLPRNLDQVPFLPDDDFVLDVGAADRPALAVFTDVDAANAPGAHVTSVTVRATAVGSGDVDGVELLAASPRGPISIASAAGTAMADVSGVIDDPVIAAATQSGAYVVSYVAPRGRNGSGRARIDVDAVEVRVRLRLTP